jgi:hypothetical protein
MVIQKHQNISFYKNYFLEKSKAKKYKKQLKKN